MFITPQDLSSTIYGYQIYQITEGDDSIVLRAISTAIDEVKGYLTPNNQKEQLDGRLRYDVAAIFSTTGESRNSLLVTHACTIAKWYIVELSNADVIYEMARQRYDRATKYLAMLANGEVTISSLPTIEVEPESEQAPFSAGSNPKFNHHF